MRVLAYNATYVGSGHNAGAEVSLHETGMLLKEAGHDFRVLASRKFEDGSGPYIVDGIRVDAFHSKHDPFDYFSRADLIVAQLETVLRAHLITRPTGQPLMQFVHNYTDYSKGILRYGDYVVYNCENTKELLPCRQPSTVLYPPVNPARYRVEHPTLYDGGAVTLVNLSDGTPPFYDKGPETFYDLARRFPDQQFLGVIGAYGTQDIRTGYPNVRFIEHTQNILDVYRQTAVLLMPSTVESFGRAAVEAAASGIPSIVSNLDGPVEAGVAHAFVEPKDFWTWEGALQDVANSYRLASDRAVKRSAQLWKRTQDQLPDFFKFVDQIG